MKTLVMICALCLVSGCATERLDQERTKLAGQPEAYKDGYVDGCSSGTKAAGNPYYQFKKDVVRFDADRLYSQGWGDGFNVCKSDYEAIGRAMLR
jgi:hypothetical protein